MDREADSIGHLRQWSEPGSLWLVRVKAGGRLQWQGKTIKLSDVAAQLPLEQARVVQHQGGKATQWIASTTVLVTRPARPAGLDARGKRKGVVKGAPLQARLVVSQVRDEAIFKRLLIASQACALAWRLMRAQGQSALDTRAFLVRLSGRQMKRTTPVTASALLAGLYMLFAINETLEHYSPEEIAQFARQARGVAAQPDAEDV